MASTGLLLAAVAVVGLVALLAVLWLLRRRYALAPSATERAAGEALSAASETHQQGKTGDATITQSPLLTDHKTTEAATSVTAEPTSIGPLSGRTSVDKAAEGARSRGRSIADAARRSTVPVSCAVKEQTANALEALSSGADAVKVSGQAKTGSTGTQQGNPTTSVTSSGERVAAKEKEVPSPLPQESQVRTVTALADKPADPPKNEAAVHRKPPEAKYEAKPSETSLPSGVDVGSLPDGAATSASGGTVRIKDMSSPRRGRGISGADSSGAHASSAEHASKGHSTPSSRKHTSNISKGTPSSKRKRKSLSQPQGEVGSLTSSTLDKKQAGGRPRASLSRRRSSTRSRSSRKSARSDIKPEGAWSEDVSPPPGWLDASIIRDQSSSTGPTSVVIPQGPPSAADSSHEWQVCNT
ncbi:uncharacterized protein LOC142589707 [Dermacentor variabilis]|uniref:uncharacterized protein LOC142589707 n=1 Tax=Dermacentor variabilis TaxID=34621 RepID=UPI003F5C3208